MLSKNFSIYASLFRYPSSHPISHIQNMVIVLFINYFLRLYYAEFILTHQISLTMSILKKTPFSAAKQAAMSSTSARYLFSWMKSSIYQWQIHGLGTMVAFYAFDLSLLFFLTVEMPSLYHIMFERIYLLTNHRHRAHHWPEDKAQIIRYR